MKASQQKSASAALMNTTPNPTAEKVTTTGSSAHNFSNGLNQDLLNQFSSNNSDFSAF